MATEHQQSIVAEALDCGHGTPEDELGAAEDVLAALEEAGYIVVPANPALFDPMKPACAERSESDGACALARGHADTQHHYSMFQAAPPA